MKNFKKALGIILAVVMTMQLGAIGFAADGNADYTIVSPYEKVIWEGDGAWGAYKGTQTKVVLTAVKKQQLADLKKMVVQIDPDAFIIVQEAHQVLGDGFHRYSRHSL